MNNRNIAFHLLVMVTPVLLSACDEDLGGSADASPALLAVDQEAGPVDFQWIQAPDPAADDVGHAEDASAGRGRQNDAILAELSVGEHGSIRFIDEAVTVPGGGVGVLTQGVSSLLAAAQAEQLSPLELFLTVAPDQDPPERLWEQHDEVAASQGRLSAAPRTLQLDALGPADLAAPTPAPLRSQVTNAFDCSETSGFWEWKSHWALSVMLVHGSGEYDFMDVEQVTGNVDVYTGAHTERWLGACVKSSTNVSWAVEVNSGGGIWYDIIGSSLTLGVDNEVRYTSSGVSLDYRARITDAAGDVVKVGAAGRTP